MGVNTKWFVHRDGCRVLEACGWGRCSGAGGGGWGALAVQGWALGLSYLPPPSLCFLLFIHSSSQRN